MNFICQIFNTILLLFVKFHLFAGVCKFQYNTIVLLLLHTKFNCFKTFHFHLTATNIYDIEKTIGFKSASIGNQFGLVGGVAVVAAAVVVLSSSAIMGTFVSLN